MRLSIFYVYTPGPFDWIPCYRAGNDIVMSVRSDPKNEAGYDSSVKNWDEAYALYAKIEERSDGR